MEQNIRLKEKKSADEQIRLNKFLSDAGYCSRREADRLVEQGVVKVNGKTAVMGQKVTINDSIMVKGKNISREDEHFIRPLREKILNGAMEQFAKGLEVEAAALGNNAGLLGACAYFRQNF